MFSNKPKIFSLVTSVIACAQTFFFFPGIWRAPERIVNKSPFVLHTLRKVQGWVSTPGISWRVVPRGSSNPDSISDPKNVIFHTRYQTWPLKSIPILRPDL